MAIKNTNLGGTDWTAGEKLASADLNDTFNAAQTSIIQLYTGSDLDLASVGTTNYEFPTITAAQIAGKNYIEIDFLMYLTMDDPETDTTFSIKIETKDVGGSYSDSLATQTVLSMEVENGIGNYFNQLQNFKWIHTLSANEKTAGIVIKITTTTAGEPMTLANKQIVFRGIY